MNNLKYTVGKPVIYMKGDANGWDGDTDMTYNAEERFFTT